jgi:hypothetical protein
MVGSRVGPYGRTARTGCGAVRRRPFGSAPVISRNTQLLTIDIARTGNSVRSSPFAAVVEVNFIGIAIAFIHRCGCTMSRATAAGPLNACAGHVTVQATKKPDRARSNHPVRSEPRVRNLRAQLFKGDVFGRKAQGPRSAVTYSRAARSTHPPRPSFLLLLLVAFRHSRSRRPMATGRRHHGHVVRVVEPAFAVISSSSASDRSIRTAVGSALDPRRRQGAAVVGVPCIF